MVSHFNMNKLLTIKTRGFGGVAIMIFVMLITDMYNDSLSLLWGFWHCYNLYYDSYSNYS